MGWVHGCGLWLSSWPAQAVGHLSCQPRSTRATRPEIPGLRRPVPGQTRCQTERVRARILVGAAILVDLAASLAAIRLTTRPDAPRLAEIVGPVTWADTTVGLAWALTGAVLAWLRPRNPVGWLLIAVGTCVVISYALGIYGEFGVLLENPAWPMAEWAGWLGSVLWLVALLPLPNVLLVLYPTGRLPSRRWRLPVVAAAVGIGLMTAACLLDPSWYADSMPEHLSPLAAPRVARVLYVAAAITFIPATLAIWAMSLLRLWRAAPPERQQLAWLLAVVMPMFVFGFGFVSLVPDPVWYAALYLIPVAVAVGIFRYNLLGIEVVMRRGLVYGALTGVVVAVYLAVTAVAGSQLSRDPLPGLLAAALVAVALTPLRERMQRAVDRLVYGERRDPLAAVTRLGDQMSADDPDLLTSVMRAVTTAVRAPGARVSAPDGRLLASYGSVAPGAEFPLRVAGQRVGVMEVVARTPGEPYTEPDRRLLNVMAPQVAVAVRALELAEALEAERDQVVTATRTERDRLRRDLHDGLGPSLAGIRLGLVALHDAERAGDQESAETLLARIQAEADVAAGEVRRIIEGLRPAALDDQGLAGALRQQSDRNPYGVHVQLAVDDLPTLPPQVETVAYRIVQEALTNIARHSGRGTPGSAWPWSNGNLSVEVADDGTGIDEVSSTGLGLDSMRRRVETLGGSFALASSPVGTTVTACLPLPEPSS